MSNNTPNMHDDYIIQFHWASRLKKNPFAKDQVIVGEHSITQVTGALRRMSETLGSIDDIEGIVVYRNLKQRIMGAGDLELTTRSGITREFNNIVNPDEAEQVIRARMAYWKEGTQLERLNRYIKSGNHHSEQEDFQKAQLSYEAAMRIDHKCEEANTGLGNALINLGEHNRAIDVLEGYLRHDSDYHGTYFLLGNAYCEKAWADKSDPENGYRKWKTGYEKAIGHYRKAADICPDDHRKDRYTLNALKKLANYANVADDHEAMSNSSFAALDLFGSTQDQEVEEGCQKLIVYLWLDNPEIKHDLVNPLRVGIIMQVVGERSPGNGPQEP